jgi:hypothetical protein
MIEDVCERAGVKRIDPDPESQVGIAMQTLGAQPINGLRNPIVQDRNGWFIWCGEYSEDDDFFQPLHVEHLSEYLPQVLKYLSLPPGYRFLIDESGYEDVWFDESLLEV